ncbi:MAG: YoaK family protein [Polyangiales bacterium]
MKRNDEAPAPQRATWSPLTWNLMALTFTSGMVDAISFLGFGHVFTALMTGNIAFLGFALAGAEGLSVHRSLVALAAFALGAAVGGRLAQAMRRATHRRWLSWAATLEVVLLLTAVGVAALGDKAPATPMPVTWMISASAAAMGVRSATTLRLGDPDLKTTVLTLAIAGIAADSPLAGGRGLRLWKRLLSILSLLAGAAMGALLLRQHGSATALTAVAAIVSLATLLYVVHPSSRTRGWGQT